MLQLDPESKAAECGRAIAVVADPECRAVLERLRSLWIALSNEHPLLDDRDAVPLSTIAQIHAQLMAAYRRAMH